MKTNKKASRKPTIQRHDHAGHLDPKYAAGLRAIGQETNVQDNDRAFVTSGRSSDDLANELGEEAVKSMTSGEDDLPAHRDARVLEEHGGPFVISAGSEEFALGFDDSNPADANREPFPRSSGAR